MNQKTGVYNAIIKVTKREPESGVKFELSDQEKKDVLAELNDRFMDCTIEYRGKFNRDTIEKYTPGLLNNWLRKDERLNGGGKYVPKNPGIRQGSGDGKMKAMRQLLSTLKDDNERKIVQAEIDKRKLELKPEVKIELANLPENLRHLVPQDKIKVAEAKVETAPAAEETAAS